AVPGGPVKGGSAGGKNEPDPAHLVDVALALRGAVARSLLAPQPLDEVFDRRLAHGVDGADAGVPAGLPESIEGCAVTVLSPKGQALDVRHAIQEALDHLVRARARVGDGGGLALIEGGHHLVRGGAGDGQVAVHPAPLADAALAVVEVVDLA